MRKFLLATTAAAVALGLTGSALAENNSVRSRATTILPPQTTTTEALVFSKDASQAKPIEAKPIEAKPAEAKPAETKPAEQAAAPSGAESGPVAQQLRDLVEGKLNQFVPREHDRAGVLAFYKARNFARSFSVPRKSPGLNILANSASRMSETICEDSDAERPGTKFRPVDLANSGVACATMPTG